MKGFKEFVLRGNVVDLAVGIVIGAAFGGVVNSFVADVLTPLTGIFGVPDFSDLDLRIGKAVLRYGLFVNATVSFLLVAAAVYFFVVRPMNTLMDRRTKGEPDPSTTTHPCPHCLSEIPKLAVRCAHCTQEVGAGP